MTSLENLKNEYKYWYIIADMIDQCIDISLNLSQSGHPGGSRSKVYAMVATLLSGVMSFDIRHPEKRLGDRFILSAGHANPMVYATLAVFNEALRRKYKQTNDKKYLNDLGNEFTLVWEDLLTLRKKGGLSGHSEMEGKTLFMKFNTGPSGHGLPASAGEALALKYAGHDDVKVITFEGEGGLTTGVTHETKNSAYGLGLGNLIWVIDWNDFGIDSRPFSDIVKGTPKDWFSPYGWKVEGTENSENFEEICNAYYRLLNNGTDNNQPKVLWLKTRKGRGYKKYDNLSHGSVHKMNSKLFWETKREFADKYNIEFNFQDSPPADTYNKNKEQMADCLKTVMSLFDKQDGLLDYLADKLIDIAKTVKDNDSIFNKNPLDDEKLFDYKNYPKEIYMSPGTKTPNSTGMYDFGSWINTYCQKKYGRPLFLVCSADLAGSTKIAGFAKNWDGEQDLGMYHREKNQKGVLFPQGITEFANAGIMAGVSSVNFSKQPFEKYNGFFGASSTYAAFSYLEYGALRLFSQMTQDCQIKHGKTLYIAGHSGIETAEDSRTHFGVFAPGVSQLFPKGQVINLHPWERNEVPVMLATAFKTDVPIIILHLTRPPIEIPDRKKLGIPSHFEASKGAYIIKDYDNTNNKQGVIIIRGAKVIEELLTILPQLNQENINVKIVAALSSELFAMQTKEYQESIISEDEWENSMVITNSAIDLMNDWIKFDSVKQYSLSADFDNRWRTGGSVDEVMRESHLSSEYQLDAILKFAKK